MKRSLVVSGVFLSVMLYAQAAFARGGGDDLESLLEWFFKWVLGV
jgi:hypothetical protein